MNFADIILLNSWSTLQDRCSLWATGEEMGSEESRGSPQLCWLRSMCSFCRLAHAGALLLPLPLLPCVAEHKEVLFSSKSEVFFSSLAEQPSPKRNALSLRSSCLRASWLLTSPKLRACLCLLGGTRICLCSVCNAHRTGLLIMPQTRLHSTSRIMNYPAPAKMSPTTATKETYLSPTLSSSCSSHFPLSSPVICLDSCNWNIFSHI